MTVKLTDRQTDHATPYAAIAAMPILLGWFVISNLTLDITYTYVKNLKTL